ncbi:MAG: hypothetical protein JST32_08200 [Bacteroidetes bacterium]|nr:hypothetical protein [Bacteroidota bacterium]
MNSSLQDVANNSLTLGGLYSTKYSDKPSRIIGFDNAEVFYDAQWSDNSWTFSGSFKRKKVAFYRMPLKIFITYSNKIGVLPLTSEELSFFRPDLPMRAIRTKKLDWNDLPIHDYNTFEKYVLENLDKDFQNQVIRTNQIVLVPTGKKGGWKKGLFISADNSSYFTATELLLKAKEIQENQHKKKSNGIGIYRLGFENGIASYSIGEYTNEYISSLGID